MHKKKTKIRKTSCCLYLSVDLFLHRLFISHDLDAAFIFQSLHALRFMIALGQSQLLRHRVQFSHQTLQSNMKIFKIMCWDRKTATRNVQRLKRKSRMMTTQDTTKDNIHCSAEKLAWVTGSSITVLDSNLIPHKKTLESFLSQNLHCNCQKNCQG